MFTARISQDSLYQFQIRVREQMYILHVHGLTFLRLLFHQKYKRTYY